MIIVKAPNKLNDISIALPASKSISNRLLMLNALSYSPYPIKNLSDCDDTRIMHNVLNSNTNRFDVGGAGTAMRFLTAYLSKIVGEWYITGNKRMNRRPIGILVDAINQLGGHIEYTENKGYPPLKILGSALTGGEIELVGDISSQYVSALLMIAPDMEKGLTLKLKGKITSAPYISMTLSLMKKFGAAYVREQNVIHISPGSYRPVEISVEGDWSAASYWFEIMALGSEDSVIHLKGLSRYSEQGDSAIAELFKPLGVQSRFTSQGLRLEKNGITIKRFSHDFTNEPDLAQTFAVTCAFLNLPFKFTGLHTLKIKETDRILALTNELRKFGFAVKNNDIDELSWNGAKTERQPDIEIKTYDDHRMAMAFAPAVLRTEPFAIENHKVTTKSYPEFWKDLRKAGFEINYR